MSLDRGAVISEDGLYRYSLWRHWDACADVMVFIMLNPSTADAEVDDPTIRRCVGFAKREGCGGIEVINLYALRATKPRHLLDHPDPEGPSNASVWRVILDYYHRGPIVAAWGSHIHMGGLPASRAFWEQGMGRMLKCLGITKGGDPKHPLYLAADTPLQRFTGVS